MLGKIYQYLADDHARLDALLQRAAARPDTIETSGYAQFRAGLLKHIAMEEKILLPAAQRLRDGIPLPAAEKLRLDHGALAALLVPTPTPAIIKTIRIVLKAHNPLEEGPEGVYTICEQLFGPQAPAILADLQLAPEVKVTPHHDGSFVMEATRHAL